MMFSCSISAGRSEPSEPTPAPEGQTHSIIFINIDNPDFQIYVDYLNTLPEFLNTKFEPVWDTIRNNHTFNAMLDEITTF